MSICLVDTSILCEILQVPNRCGNHREIFAEMERKIRTDTLLLPMSAIIETGNHIGHNGGGRQRRKLGQSPFTATQLFKKSESLLEWLDDFPDWAGRGSGLGDLTILKEFDRQCTLNPSRLIYIWSLDGHLSSYHREP